MKTIGCIIARTSSTRLPKKVLIDIDGKMLIEHLIERIRSVKNLDEIYLCTSIEDNDKILLSIAKKNMIRSFAGSRESVIDRMIAVANIENADNLVRITGDNIFTDPIFLDKAIEQHCKSGADYTRVEYLPIGITAEVIKVNALKRCFSEINPKESEYLALFMFNPDKYRCLVIIPPASLQRPYFSLTVDTKEDLDRTIFIIDRLKSERIINYKDIIDLSTKEPIPHLEVNKESMIKLPGGRQIPFGEYRRQSEEKIINSLTLTLEDSFIDAYKPY